MIKKEIQLKAMFTFIVSILMTGCVSTPPNVDDVQKKYTINVNEINVADLSTPNASVVSMPGQLKMGDNISNPPFTVYVYNSLKSSLKPSKEKNKESLDVMLLNANLLITISTVDYIPFFSIASALSNREQICTVGLNLKMGSLNIKKIFENKVSSSKHFVDLDTESKKQFLENCVSAIVDDVAKFANEMIESKKKDN